MKQKFKKKFAELYLIPQESKWKRIVDSFAVILCFLSALIALYVLKTQPEGKLPTVSNLVVWGYLLTSIPLFFLLYKNSQLKKIERFALVLFILLSSMSLLFLVTSVYIKHNNKNPLHACCTTDFGMFNSIKGSDSLISEEEHRKAVCGKTACLV